jgi:hypothetical protein
MPASKGAGRSGGLALGALALSLVTYRLRRRAAV